MSAEMLARQAQLKKQEEEAKKYEPSLTAAMGAYAIKEPTPTPTPVELDPSIVAEVGAYEATMVQGPTQQELKDASIEQQIMEVYRRSPVEQRVVGVVGARPEKFFHEIKAGYYAPYYGQRQQIIKLAKQLSPEKRKKYVTEPEPQPELVKEEAKGLGEFLAGISIQEPLAQLTSAITGTDVKTVRQVQALQQMMPPSLRPVEPIKEVGGWVTLFEVPGYTVGKILGLETPRVPPTLTGGLISAALGDPSELEQVRAYGPEYARGTILADIVLSYVTGWALGKMWTGAKMVPVVRKGPAFVEKIGVKLVGKLPKQLQAWLIQEEAVYRPTAIARERYLAMKMGKMGLRRTPSMTIENLSKSWAKGTQLVGAPVHTPFATTFAPTVTEVSTRGGKLLLRMGQQLAPPAAQVTKQLTFRTIVKPATELITRQMLKTMAKTLTLQLPKTIPLLAWAGLKYPFISARDIVAKTAPKLKPYPVLKPLTKLKTYPITKEAIKISPMISQVPILRPLAITKQVQRQEAKQIQKQMLKQLQVQAQVFVHMSKQLQKQTRVKLPPFRRRRISERQRKASLQFGQWYFKRHRIATPEELAHNLISFTKKRRKKRKRVRDYGLPSLV